MTRKAESVPIGDHEKELKTTSEIDRTEAELENLEISMQESLSQNSENLRLRKFRVNQSANAQ